MNKPNIETLEYITEYTDLLDDATQEIAEKILFDGGTEALDALERDVFSNRIMPLLNPACEGIDGAGCHFQGVIEPEGVLTCHQQEQFICEECQQSAEMRKAS